jgi:hypothetical protein
MLIPFLLCFLVEILQDEWPLLVIVPASLRLVWAEEIEKWMPHIRPSQVSCEVSCCPKLCGCTSAELLKQYGSV